MLSLTRAAVKEIEDRGFRVRGYHDAINEGPAPLVLTATDTSTGKIYTRIFNLMYELQTIQRPSASLLIGARAR